MEEQSFLGQGWGFPLNFNRASGTVTMSRDEDDIAQSLLILLQTAIGERTMRPKWGASPANLLFESLSVTSAALMIEDIRKAIRQEERRVEVITIDMTPQIEEGRLDLEIEYRVKATNSRYNLVYPYYINESPTGIG